MSLRCLAEDGNERPSMNDVVWTLEFALELQESKEFVDEKEPLMKRMMDDEESDDVGFTSSDVTVTDSKSSSRITICNSEPATASSPDHN